MAYTEQDLTAIDAAIAELQRGERIASVTYDGYTVQYAPIHPKDLMLLRNHIEQALKAAASLQRTTRILTTTAKGTE